MFLEGGLNPQAVYPLAVEEFPLGLSPLDTVKFPTSVALPSAENENLSTVFTRSEGVRPPDVYPWGSVF